MISHAERVREFYRKQGSDRELQRIVKLLNDTYDSDHFVGLNMHQVIALIKGENK